MLCMATVWLSERLKSERMQCLTQSALCWSHRVQKRLKQETVTEVTSRMPKQWCHVCMRGLCWTHNASLFNCRRVCEPTPLLAGWPHSQHTICLSMSLSRYFLPPGSVRPCHRSLCAHNQSVDPTSMLNLLTKCSHDMVFFFFTRLRANWAQMQQCKEELAEKDKALCSTRGRQWLLCCVWQRDWWRQIQHPQWNRNLPHTHTQLAEVEC